jgi:hypothetical protein
MPHKIEASHPAYGHVTWEIEAGSPEKAFAIWKQIVSNPRGWNRIVNEPAPAKPSGSSYRDDGNANLLDISDI